MRVVTDLASFEPPPKGSVVTIGAYDGVHLGHQAVLRLVRELADARRHDAVCLTFDRHPAEVVRPDTAPRVLCALDQKLELLDATGYLDATCVLRFDEERSREPAEAFVSELLVRTLGARLVVVGADFHFGHHRHGNVRLLEQMGAELGFEVLGLGLVTGGDDPSGVPYSSTRIRQLVESGRVREAAALLGRPPRPHEVRGVVERGDGRGQELGFPTANIRVPERICLPAEGIYAGTVVDHTGIERCASISLGTRPTFYPDATDPLLEAYLLDFSGELYDQHVRVRFTERVRGQERFDSPQALVHQMERDVETTRRICAAI